MYTQTFYVFIRGNVEVDKAITPNLWLYHQQAAFTVDSSGSNLPNYLSWHYYGETQPDEELLNFNMHLSSISSQAQVERGLREKGWYLGRIHRGQLGMEEARPFHGEPRPFPGEAIPHSNEGAHKDFLDLVSKLPRGTR
jgi:hypothetical protein